MSKSSKRKLNELTYQKKQVVDHLNKCESCRKLAVDFHISKSTESNINCNKSAIIEAWEQNCSAQRK